MIQEIHPVILKGEILIPPSKSDSQRAILCAGLADGKSMLKNCGESEDELNMLKTITDLGAKVQRIDSNSIEICGINKFPLSKTIHVGESGLGLRLLTSICAAQDGEFMLEGSGTLLKRPMNFFDETFPKLYVDFSSNNGFLPFKINGPMIATSLTVDGSQSSQYISGLLMAFPFLDGKTSLIVENLKSIPYLEMTLKTVKAFGITIENQHFEEFIIAGNQHYLPAEYSIESDWSSASYWIVAAALGADILIKGLSMASLQADKKILEALANADCTLINFDNGFKVEGENRKPFYFDATHCPDLFPALTTLAALTTGISRIEGVHRLSSKESDRGEVLQQEFQKLGIKIEFHEDEMVIYGQSSISGGSVKSHLDHRIAMCLGIAGVFANSTVIMEDSEAVSKSYPNFWNDLNDLISPTTL
jgi:3-phosphoshikimate 1-carboxyvinyltransferase